MIEADRPTPPVPCLQLDAPARWRREIATSKQTYVQMDISQAYDFTCLVDRHKHPSPPFPCGASEVSSLACIHLCTFSSGLPRLVLLHRGLGFRTASVHLQHHLAYPARDWRSDTPRPGWYTGSHEHSGDGDTTKPVGFPWRFKARQENRTSGASPTRSEDDRRVTLHLIHLLAQSRCPENKPAYLPMYHRNAHVCRYLPRQAAKYVAMCRRMSVCLQVCMHERTSS